MFAYRAHFIPTNIVIIGGGGTGSRLIPPLAQLVRSSIRKNNPLSWIEKINIHIIDGDVVETKNLVRKNFISPDVGKNKAVVLAERYSKGFDIPIAAIPKFLMEEEDLDPWNYESPTGKASLGNIFKSAVIILAVDSAKARKRILNEVIAADPSGNQFWIDAGNEDDFGQIKCFTSHTLWATLYRGDPAPASIAEYLLKGMPDKIPCRMDIPFIPFDERYYHHLGESVEEKSCADLPQTLAINTAMSTLILCTLQNFLQMRPISYECQRFSLNGSMTTTQLSPLLLAKRAFGRNGISPGSSVHNAYANCPQIIVKPFNTWATNNAEVSKLYQEDLFQFLKTCGPFWALGNLVRKTYDEAGMTMMSDGLLVPKAPPEPPALVKDEASSARKTPRKKVVPPLVTEVPVELPTPTSAVLPPASAPPLARL